MDTDDTVILNRANRIETLLRKKYGARGSGMGLLTNSVAASLPIMSVLALRRLAEIRNKVIKGRRSLPFEVGGYPREMVDLNYFERLAAEVIELLEASPRPSAHEAKRYIKSRSVTLRAANGLFVATELQQHSELVANREHAQEWESYSLFDLGDGNVALQACNGNYVLANLDQDGELMAVSQSVQGWETFKLVPVAGDTFALQAFNGLFVSAQLHEGRWESPYQNGLLVANATELREWEVFSMRDTA